MVHFCKFNVSVHHGSYLDVSEGAINNLRILIVVNCLKQLYIHLNNYKRHYPARTVIILII